MITMASAVIEPAKRGKIVDLITAHRAAVFADEALFDGDGNPIFGVDTDASGQGEREAFVHLVKAPCGGTNDVQAKLDYIVNGTVGDRERLTDCLIEYSDGDTDLVGALLKSLIVKTVKGQASGGSANAPTLDDIDADVHNLSQLLGVLAEDLSNVLCPADRSDLSRARALSSIAWDLSEVISLSIQTLHANRENAAVKS